MEKERSSRRFGRTVVAVLAVASVAATAGLLRGSATLHPPPQRGDERCSPQLRNVRENPRDSMFKKAARECVNGADHAQRRDAHGRILFDRARLADIHSMIPEYHDEQRLRSEPAPRRGLGPQAGIYVSPHLGDFTRLWQFIEHGPEGVLVAYVVVSQLPGETLPPTYAALGLDFGLNCLYLVRTSAGTPWSGIVKKMGTGRSCDRTQPGVTTTLNVVETQLGGTSNAAYPPVARFGESTNLDPLLGVKCLNAWCEMGAGTFRSLPPLMQSLRTVEATVKGWHDEQLLSEPVWDSPTTYVFQSTDVRAAIIPVPGVDNIEEARFRGNWIEVGSIHLNRDPPTTSKYYRWGLRRGENKISLKYDPPPSPIAPKIWHVEMAPGNGTRPIPWSFNQREEHRDVGIIGTLRFRWTILDDGIWAPCGSACCQVEG